MQHRNRRAWRALALPLFFLASVAQAQGKITTPKEFFGHNIGDDYWLATYDQFVAYWKKIDAESDRMQVIEIGKTAEGRPQYMAIVTAPENFKKLDRYKEISRKLAMAEGLSEAEARALAKEGKAVVWIDGGLHATEVLGAHQLLETSYQLVSKNDEETRRLLNDDIMLLVHVNPDGMQLVSSWYMREADTLRRNTQIPRLYQKYIGHDDNRDYYMSNQVETQNENFIMYRDWLPQIVYNHHQTGPAGTVMFSPPFRDPFNYNFDPLVVVGIDLVAAAMHTRFLAEGKPGVGMRATASYSTWFNGGLRTTSYFHNMIGLLTETIGNPTPMRIPLVPTNQLPRADLPMPIAPQEWHFRQSIDYSVTANWAVMDVASRFRETLLFNIWRMGKNSIERGNRDSWTVTDHDVQRLIAAAPARGGGQGGSDAAPAPAGNVAQSVNAPAGRTGAPSGQGVAPRPDRESPEAAAPLFERMLRDPAKRDPRGYVLSSSQTDFPTATKFVNTLRHVGVIVERATREFTIKGKTYPAGSYVVPAAQAFRPHVLDMFEPQDHPNDFAYPGGPPKRPYDAAGYTLAFTMGVEFDRILDAYQCPCERITGFATPMAATVANGSGATGYLLSPSQNDAFVAVNRFFKGGASVSRLTAPVSSNGKTYPTGTFYVPSGGSVVQTADAAAKGLGIRVEGTTARPTSVAPVKAPRIGLWDVYGGSMPSGWTRWLLEQYEFPFNVIYTQQLDSGNLRAKYDVLVFVDGAISIQGQGGRGGGGGGGGGFGQQQRQPPEEFRYMVGRPTRERTVPQLRKFLEEGGQIVTIGSSTQLAYLLELPVSNALVERSPGGERVLPADKYYVPGSVLRVAVDSTADVAAGSRSHMDVFFDNSPVFNLNPDAQGKGVRPVAWFDTAEPLRSGWAWGQNYLEGGITMATAKVGRGTLYLFGPEVLFRGQPHGTFKFFFNALVDATRSPAPLVP